MHCIHWTFGLWVIEYVLNIFGIIFWISYCLTSQTSSGLSRRIFFFWILIASISKKKEVNTKFDMLSLDSGRKVFINRIHNLIQIASNKKMQDANSTIWYRFYSPNVYQKKKCSWYYRQTESVLLIRRMCLMLCDYRVINPHRVVNKFV